MATSKISPFAPGTAAMPPHLAGREGEQRIIAETLGSITKPRTDGLLEQPPMAPIKIIGPRGVGKTTLLVWAEREAEKQGIPVVSCVELKGATPGEGLAVLVSRMLEKCGTSNNFVASLETSNLASLKVDGQVEAARIYRNVLESLLKKTPVAMVMDEVMHYDSIPLAIVLRESQALINEGWPLVVIIAGTPSLGPHLMKADATFFNYAQKLPINLISDEATCEALREPFKKHGVKVADDAIELMASWTDNYPYFIQLAGEAVWDAMKAAGRSEVDLSLAKEANEALQENLDIFYEDVYEDIRDGGLISYARLVVDLVEDSAEPLAPEKVVAALEEHGNKKQMENKMDFEQVLDSLQDLGLVWIADGRRVCASLPSFFTYFKSEQRL